MGRFTTLLGPGGAAALGPGDCTLLLEVGGNIPPCSTGRRDPVVIGRGLLLPRSVIWMSGGSVVLLIFVYKRMLLLGSQGAARRVDGCFSPASSVHQQAWLC